MEESRPAAPTCHRRVMATRVAIAICLPLFLAPAAIAQGLTIGGASGITMTLSSVSHVDATYIASTTYNTTIQGPSLENGERILRGAVDASLPAGVELALSVSGPGISSFGWVTLNTTNQALHSGVLGGDWNGNLSVRLRATPAALPTTTGRTVTISAQFTILRSDTLAVTTDIGSLTSIVASVGSPLLVVNTAVAGQAPNPVTHAGTGTYYLVGTNLSNMKVTGRLDSPMPAHTTVSASLQPPAGASGLGWVQLGTTDADLVSGISKIVTADDLSGRRSVSYRFSATPAAGVVSAARSVTFTITSGS